MRFRAESGSTVETDRYAHEEYAAGHPDPEVSVTQYRAVDYDPAAGVEWVTDTLPISHTDRFSSPPSGGWLLCVLSSAP